MGLGIDMTQGPIPVVPAQHYTCGGIVVDHDGRTDLPGLYARASARNRGCTARTGSPPTRSSNASCSARPRPRHIAAQWDALAPVPTIRPWDESRVTDSDEEVVIKQNWTEIRRFMWNYVGIVRTTKRLQRAAARIRLLREEVADYYGHFRVTPDLIELRNLVETADLIVRSALRREESRGRTTRWTIPTPRRSPWIRCWCHKSGIYSRFCGTLLRTEISKRAMARRPLPSVLRGLLTSGATAGLLLMAAAAIALVVANSSLGPAYAHALHVEWAGLSITHWINDALMALFFLLVGLEIKRELVDGHLSSWADRALPGLAAIGGMVVPALIYVLLAGRDPALCGAGRSRPRRTSRSRSAYWRCSDRARRCRSRSS
jgi:hypothetical protein